MPRGFLYIIVKMGNLAYLKGFLVVSVTFNLEKIRRRIVFTPVRQAKTCKNLMENRACIKSVQNHLRQVLNLTHILLSLLSRSLARELI